MEGWKEEEEMRGKRKQESVHFQGFDNCYIHVVLIGNASMKCIQSHSTARDRGIPATWGEREEEEEDWGRPWALQNGGFLPHPPLPHPPALRQEVAWWKGTEEEKRMDQRVPHHTDERRKGEEKGRQRKVKESKYKQQHKI